MKRIICLGIESTAHTFGAGIAKSDGSLLANAKAAYTTAKGGIHPNKAKEHHLAVADDVINRAISQAKIPLKDIDLISFSQGPGLAPCLIVGMGKAKELSIKLNKPIVGVNHCISHLSIGELIGKCSDPVLLYVSGANTQVIAYDAGKYRIFGETIDNGCGNFLDAFGRYLGIGFPGGPKIYELALKGKNYVELPYSVKGMDVSFGGILTNLKQKLSSGKYSKMDLAYSCQETAFAMLIEVAERAMAHCGKNELLLGGGVSCNKRLKDMAKIMCSERNAKCFIPPDDVLADNGLMIAWQGILQQKSLTSDLNSIDIKPYERTDDIDASWK